MNTYRASKASLRGWFGHHAALAAGSLASLWRRKGLGAARTAGRGLQLERLERLALSPQHSLHLVRVAGRALLLGVSPAGIQVLERLGPPEGLAGGEGSLP